MWDWRKEEEEEEVEWRCKREDGDKMSLVAMVGNFPLGFIVNLRI